MKYLVAEPSIGGHYLAYLRLIVHEATHRGDELVLALAPDVENTIEFELHLADLRTHFELVSLDRPLTPSYAAKLAGRHGCGQLLVPNGDRFLMRLSLHRRCRFKGLGIAGLVMQDPAWIISSRLTTKFKARMKMRLLERATRMPGVRVAWLRGPGFSSETSRLIAHDPVIIDDPASRSNSWLPELDKSLYWFGLFGAINCWKSPLLVLDALYALERRNVGLFLGGLIDDGLKGEVSARLARIEHQGKRVVVLDRVLSNQEMNAAVASVDCVVVAYTTHAPPSTIGKAAAYGTRIVVAGSATLREHAAELDVGAVGAELSVESLSQAMGVAASLDRPPAKLGLGVGDFPAVLLGSCGQARS